LRVTTNHDHVMCDLTILPTPLFLTK
jgi:hypothetical protein